MKPSIPQGTRDFGPETVKKRQFIFNTIRSVFELYGFQPLETPAMELLDTLMGKYGEEGDKLIFKILNNGLGDPKNIEKSRIAFENVLQGKNDKNLTERALRYDLTIPFARYVAMNHHQLAMPFKRYQMQPVWRADRPQKGRYREFYQCDADVVGSHSLLNEVELTMIYATVFERLGIPVEIRLNNRKILAALAAGAGNADDMVAITTAIDKLDKIGIEKVKEELFSKGLQDTQVNLISDYLQVTGSNEEKMARVAGLLQNQPLVKEGLNELEYILSLSTPLLEDGFSKIKIVLDFTLARGLNYYTGTIFEIKAPDVQMGSIGGGGRYDDLTGLFGLPNIPGVGISFGVDRIYDVMEELNLFPAGVGTTTQVLFFNLGEQEAAASLQLCQQLRNAQIRAELFHENAKMKKQFDYAEKKGIRFVVIVGEQELSGKTAAIKNIDTGEQVSIPWDALTEWMIKEL